MTTRIIDIVHEPRHWNRNCGCFIPAAWVGVIEVDGERLPKWHGNTPRDIVEAVKREFPRVVGTQSAHAVMYAHADTLATSR